jgi:hypothetical protein
MKTFTWAQLMSYVQSDFRALNFRDIASLLTYARQSGIGKAISFQKTSYSNADLIKAKRLIYWWKILNENSAYEWRDKRISEKIQKVLTNSVATNVPFDLFAVFCPSYRTGHGVYGYTGLSGDHTRTLIHEMSKLVKKTNEVGIMVNATAYFSDLLLENYQYLKGTNYKIDLAKNYKDFKTRIVDESDGLIKVSKLSSRKELRLTIGEAGITCGKLNVPANIYQRVLKRNNTFYKKHLGWNKSQVENRTEILARCYSYMGRFFKRMHPNGIMYWVESAYERGAMYSGLEQQNPLPIIYPKKHGA